MKEEQKDQMPLLTIEELARYLNVKPSWVYMRTRDNSIPCLRVGKMIRFRLEDVMQWVLEGQARTPTPRQFKTIRKML